MGRWVDKCTACWTLMSGSMDGKDGQWCEGRHANSLEKDVYLI